jgi:signal transduction histidine kinase
MDLAESVRQVIAEQQSAISSQHHFVLEGLGSLRGTWDPERIAQTLTNLISNAVKYSPEGGAIGIRLRQIDDTAEIVVRDQGVGLTSEQLSQLFQPFVRFESEQAAGGTGLGLYIAKGIVEAHGGHIRVESTPGLGTAFRITLPTKPARLGGLVA